MHPTHFFKFRPWPRKGKNHTRTLLEKTAFWCSNPRDLDDPHDNQLGAHPTGGDRDIDRWLLHDMAGIPDLMRKYKLRSLTHLFDDSLVMESEDRKILAASAGRKTRRNSRVLCLSSDFSSELMWAFYSNNHEGICLCFDAQHDYFKAARPVLYTHTPTDVFHMGPEGTTDQAAFCKSLSWQFQKEWRLILPGDEPKLVPFPKCALKAVILGYRFSEVCSEELKTILVEHGYQVELLRAERIPNSFTLGLIELGKTMPK